MRVHWFSVLSLALLVGIASAAPLAAPDYEKREAAEKRDPVEVRQTWGEGPGSW